METVIVVRDLIKSYGDLTAVDGVSFEVYENEIFGIVGPNGAGKTTTSVIILGSLALADFIVTVLGIALLTVVAVLVYDASLAGSLISFLAGFVLAFLSLAAIFLFIPAVARSPRSAGAIGMFIYFPVMFFSGVLIPLDMLPDWIAGYISLYLPVTHAVELMQGLWLGTPLLDLTREVFILLGILCLGLVIAARTFRWE